jgi:hypothetical protein
MKPDQFKSIIRAIVKEEVTKLLPVLVPKIMTEAFNERIKNVPVIAEKNSFFDKLSNDLEGNTTQHAPIKPVVKQKKTYTSNTILNDILNETEGGVPQEQSYGAPIPNFNKLQSANLNINTPQQPAIINEETKAQAKLGVFKDYRKLMKAVDNKKKQGPFGASMGGLSIDDGVPNDFSTID